MKKNITIYCICCYKHTADIRDAKDVLQHCRYYYFNGKQCYL